METQHEAMPNTVRHIFFAVLLVSSIARADSLESNPNDAGHVTNIKQGVWEVDIGALGVLSSDTQGDATITRFSTDGAVTVSRFIKDNVSLGLSALGSYDTSGDSSYSFQLGGAVVAALHLRLGMGAFFRPGLALGALFGSRHTPLMDGVTEEASQVGFIARLQLPLAYFTSRRFVLQAGPQVNFTAGQYTPTGKDAQRFTRIAGGFAIGAGYAF